jgi:hypothetical protein
VVWDQDTPSTPQVRYGLTAPLSQVATSSASGGHHEVKLTGLQAGATYTYAVYQGNTKLSADLTLPSVVPTSTPFRFLVFGDTRSDEVAHQKQVYAMALEQGVRFFINTGDLVADGEVQSDWDTFFTVEHPLISHVPLFPIIGNHDEVDGEYALYKSNFVMQSNSPAPEAYYSFTYGNSFFLMLDGHVHVDPWFVCVLQGKLYEDCFKAGQLNWLKQQLQAASANPLIEHIFVAIHSGPYSSKQGRTGNAQMRDLLPLFKTHGVTLILSGHDHYYERGVSGNGIPYVITGGGGAPLYTVDTPSLDPHTVIFNDSVYHYLVIDVQGTLISAKVKTADGILLDQFQLGPPPPPDSGPGPVDGAVPLPDAGSQPTPDTGPQPAPDSGVPPGSDITPASQPDVGTQQPSADEEGGCSCQMHGTTSLSLPVLLMPVLLMLMALICSLKRRAG